MKNSIIALIFLFVAQIGFAQVKGNKQIVTQEFTIENIKSIDIHLYAQIEIDVSAKENLSITADQNLMDLIDRTVDDGRLTLEQVEWIEASQPIKIKIGASNLQQITQSTHQTVLVKNLDKESFSAMALVGKIKLEGKVKKLGLGVEVGEIDARQLEVADVNVNIWGWGTVELGTPDSIKGVVKESGKLIYSGTNTVASVHVKSDGIVENRDLISSKTDSKARYIDLKIKNNSMKRINAYVKGKKPKGGHFSYGFPMNPGQARKENWPIGSKIYLVNKLGTKKLLVQIEEKDEGKTVELHAK